ncbi:hypothetical protein [Methylobacterium sp. Leaf456]|uniref:hypothetical protein n=1 Tax=Methylobacterium sp. Leaf456 TaxID=1736382 RepID=UPI0012E3AC53|nr:hypothetical protein [Methylobacterium sp. Leaf456]
MAPTTHLALINVFIGDIQGRLGPSLGTWLAQQRPWSPSEIGIVPPSSGAAPCCRAGRSVPWWIGSSGRGSSSCCPAPRSWPARCS